MKGSSFLVAFLVVASVTATAWSQVVQLPTFEQFGVSTTVMVPDSGSTTIAGSDRAREAAMMSGVGPLRNRAIGREFASSRLGIGATIMDLHELDEGVLRAAGNELNSADVATLQKAGRLTRDVARSSGKGPSSLAAIRRERAQAEEAQRQQIAEYVQRGDAFQQQGKLTTARTFYRMALKRTANEQLRRDIAVRLARLETR